ncbi:MAG: type II toxin-antitoxin system mRNA interferase toxin, RelE/StbE family [Candidatus Diapherotrites archaeon]|nr:type II toxin-antitoxin system mRNA interferase toxin, RelE/StbE family [Candidatus Diapherotrites archaeon]
MQYKIKFSKEFEKSMKKLKKRNPSLFKQIQKKLIEIIKHPEHYKPLKHDLAGYRRVHFGSFVLVYTIRKNTVKIISVDHHDKAY